MNSVDVSDIFICIFDIIQFDFAIYDSGADGCFERFGLFHDFFHHEVIITAFFRSGDIPCYIVDIFFDFVFIQIQNGDAIFFQYNDFVVIQQIIVFCVFQQSGNVRSDEVFIFTDTNQHRAVFSNCNDFIRFFATQDAQCVRTSNSADNTDQCINHIAVIVVIEQLCNNFSICFGSKNITFFFQFRFQLQIVFDNTVMHNGNSAVHACMRMRIHIAGCAMGCPSCMTDTNLTFYAAHFLNFCVQICKTAFCFHYMNAIAKYSDTSRVITSIF